MSLDSKYNWIKKFSKLLTNFKILRPKNPKTQLKKERIMKYVDELYEKYYNAYKNDCYNDDESNETKKKYITTNSLNCLTKQIKSRNQMKKQKYFFKEIEKKKRFF